MFTSVFTIARYSLLEAIRGRIVWIFVALLFISILISLFTSQVTLTETRETEVALMAGFLRLSSVFVIIFFVTGSIARDFQDKSIELLFAIAIPRYQVFFGKLAGFSLLAFISSLIYATGLIFFADISPVLIWMLSLWCELTLVALLSFIFILSLESMALSLIVSIGSYTLMRLLPAMQHMGDGPFQDSLFNRFINSMIDIIDLFLPRLDHFAQSSWLVKQSVSTADWLYFLLEFCLFISLFVIVGIIDLRRKAI